MSNVLYVGHYREASGWGQVIRDNILALDAAGIPVVPRSINLGLAHAQMPDRILELEKEGDPTQCNVIIQHVLPHYMKYDSHFRKNIGIFELETYNIRHTQWVDHLNIMDELWVPCKDMMELDGVRTTSVWMPHACDIDQYQEKYDPLNLPNIDNKFVFYFIGEYNRRKRIPAILRAFHTEFDPAEPVELVLKLNHPTMDAESLAQDVIDLCNKIKDGLRLYASRENYKSETVITVDLPRHELMRLHASCDCFVCTSYGEAWCLPAFDAMAMSNIVIAGKTGGPKDYITDGVNGFLVEGRLQPLFGETNALPEFGTSRELEFDVSISDLQKKMRQAYHLTKIERQNMKTQAAAQAAMYSYARIGNKMKELLSV